jgi:hypothetical protein
MDPEFLSLEPGVVIIGNVKITVSGPMLLVTPFLFLENRQDDTCGADYT